MRLIASLILLLNTFICGLSYAADDFAVNIKVDITDQSLSIAREKAINEASKAAVISAAKRISDSDGVEKISAMNNDQLLNFIKETGVEDEKTSTNRYMANLHLVVNTDLLKTYMIERQIYVSNKVIPAVIIVPVFSEFNGENPKLWEIDNPWKKAWDNADFSSSTNFAVIRDTPGNISAISAQQAFDFDTGSLKQIKELNNADDVYVLKASYNGIEGLNVDISALSGYRGNIHVEGIKSSGEELFDNALAQVMPIIEEQVSSLDISSNDNTLEEITILFPFVELGDWVAAEQKIKALEEVSDLQVQAFSPGKAQFIIRYSGDKENLIRSFQAAGYSLEDSGNYMILGYIGD